jgi:hypothetical protein
MPGDGLTHGPPAHVLPAGDAARDWLVSADGLRLLTEEERDDVIL